MKISEKRLKQIIKEEMELQDQYMDREDPEGGMAKSQLKNLADYASEMAAMLDENTQLESWVQSKITLAQDYISKVKHYLEDELGMVPGGCDGTLEITSVEPTDELDVDEEELLSLTEK